MPTYLASLNRSQGLQNHPVATEVQSHPAVGCLIRAMVGHVDGGRKHEYAAAIIQRKPHGPAASLGTCKVRGGAGHVIGDHMKVHHDDPTKARAQRVWSRPRERGRR